MRLSCPFPVLGSCRFFLIIVWLYVGTVALAERRADPDPARFAGEMEALEDQAEATPATPAGAVVATGSSSMRIWHSRIREDLVPLTIIPRGFGGSHFSDLNHYFDELVGRYNPRAVIVYEGDNDIASGKSRMRVFKDFLEFMEKTQALPEPPRIYVVSVKPSISRTRVWEEMQGLNRLLEEYSRETENVTYVDVASSMMTPEGEMDPTVFREDNLHLNSTGYDRWAEAVRAVVVPLEVEFETSNQPSE